MALTVSTSKKSSTPISADMSGWEDMDVRVSRPGAINRGLFIDIIGVENSGKSSFALTMPGRIAYADIDQSVDRAYKPPSKKVNIHPVRYSLPLGISKEQIRTIAHAAWSGMEQKVRAAAATWADSAVLDTGTEGWELKRFDSFGELNPKGRRMDRLYGPVNAQFRQFLRSVYRDNKKHLAIIHQTYDEYIDKMKDGEMQSIRTGKKIPKGFKEISYMADLQVKTFREDGVFKVEVLVCKLPPNGPTIEGVVLEGEDATFAGVVAMATGTEVEQWL